MDLRAGFLLSLTVVSCCVEMRAAAFGNVVVIGGHASDLALDERRGQLYVANFAGKRVDVVSTSDRSLRTPIPVDGEPGSLALSPDGRYLLVSNYDNLCPNAPQLIVIDLDGNKRTVLPIPPGNGTPPASPSNCATPPTAGVGTPGSPLAIAFGNASRALLVTNTGLYSVDPAS